MCVFCMPLGAVPTAGGGFAARTAPFFFFFGVPTLFLAGRSFFLPATHSAARCASLRERSLASPRTNDRRTNETTYGPQEWLTGTLHYGGIRSVRSPLRRPPLRANPYRHALAMRPPRKARPFSFLNYCHGSHKTRRGPPGGGSVLRLSCPPLAKLRPPGALLASR